MRYLMPGFVALLLAGCASPRIEPVTVTMRAELPLPGDSVQVPGQAIAIARRICAAQTDARGDWGAEFDNRGWYVTLRLDGPRKAPAYFVEIQASDGKAGDCVKRVAGDASFRD